MEAQALAAVRPWSQPGAPLASGEAERVELKRLTQHILDLGRPEKADLWQVPQYVMGHPTWSVQRWGHPSLDGWFHQVWGMAADLGITQAAGVPLDEAAQRSRETAFGRLGREWSSITPQPGDLLEIMGGVRGALGAADEKILAAI